MRNIRARSRLKIFFSLIAAIAITIFVEDRIEALVPDMKNFAESRISEAIGRQTKFSIGSITGGLVRPIALSNVRMTGPTGEAAVPFLLIDNVSTNCRVWDILLAIYKSRGKGASGLSRSFSGLSRVDVKFRLADKGILGFARLENIKGDISSTGYLRPAGGAGADFRATFKDGHYGIDIKFRGGTVSLAGPIPGADGKLKADFRVYHVDAGGHDLVCDGNISAALTSLDRSGGGNILCGEVSIRNCLLDYKPFLNFNADFVLTKESLSVPSFSFSDIVRGGGNFEFNGERRMNLTVTANNLSMSWLSIALGAKEEQSVLSGTLNGKCVIEGPAANLASTTEMIVKDGSMSGLEFECLSAHFKGEGPMVRIEDSRVTRDSGYFEIGGELDLRKMGKPSMFDGLRLVGDDKAINWDGWNATKLQKTSEVRMKKRLNDDVDLDFKKFISDNSVDEGVGKDDEVQLEYKLHPNDSLKMTIGQDKDFLGIEHKGKF